MNTTRRTRKELLKLSLTLEFGISSLVHLYNRKYVEGQSHTSVKGIPTFLRKKTPRGRSFTSLLKQSIFYVHVFLTTKSSFEGEQEIGWHTLWFNDQADQEPATCRLIIQSLWGTSWSSLSQFLFQVIWRKWTLSFFLSFFLLMFRCSFSRPCVYDKVISSDSPWSNTKEYCTYVEL